MDQREIALARRHTTRQATLQEHTKKLVPLKLGMVVSVQNQKGNKPKRWDLSGIVVEVKEHNQYLIKMDGTGRASLRNRQFLRPIIPYLSARRGDQPEVSLAQDEVSLAQPEVSLVQPEASQHLPTLPSSTSRRESKRSAKGQPPTRLITTMA